MLSHTAKLTAFALLAFFGILFVAIDRPVSAQATSVSCTTFARDLEIGDTGSDVQDLQRYLNTHGFVLALAGPGSPGNETLKFGNATKYQLAQFQKANSISPAAGYFGPKTRAAVSGTCTSGASSGPSTGQPLILTRSLSKGATGSDVLALQRFLIDLGFLSSDSATGYYGPLTAAAVAKFQKDHGLEAVGNVGPLTRALPSARRPRRGRPRRPP